MTMPPKLKKSMCLFCLLILCQFHGSKGLLPKCAEYPALRVFRALQGFPKKHVIVMQ